MKLLQLLLLGLAAYIAAANDYVYPENCRNDNPPSCLYTAKFIVKKDTIECTIVAKQNQVLWTGIAFSKGNELKDAEILYGYINSKGQGVGFDGSWDHVDVAPKIDKINSLISWKVSYADGYLTFFFVHPRKKNTDQEYSFMDEDCYYVHYPVGGGRILNDAGTIGKVIEKPPKVSAEAVCFKLTEEEKRVGYYSTLAQHREGDAQCLPDHIDPMLFSHLTLAYANISTEHKLMATDPKDIESGGLYDKFIEQKKKNPKVKMILAIAGNQQEKVVLKEMLKTEATRRTFIDSTVEFLNNHKFEGCSIDFENLEAEDKPHLTSLFKEMHQKFSEAKKPGNNPLIITTTVPSNRQIIDTGYDLPEIQKTVEFMNIQTYDLYNKMEKVTAHHSALFPGDNTKNAERNIKWVVEYYKTKGVEMSKLVVGMPAYGRTFKLENAGNHDLGAPIVGPGPVGNCTNEEGFMCYFEICKVLSDSSVKPVVLQKEKVPYLVTKQGIWVAYDDQKSLKNKVEWLKEQGCGGWMVFMTDFDDFSGEHCNQGPYPLIKTLSETLLGGETGVKGVTDETVTVSRLEEIISSTTFVTVEHTMTSSTKNATN